MTKCSICDDEMRCRCEKELKGGREEHELICILSPSPPFARLMPNGLVLHFCSSACARKQGLVGPKPTALEDSLLAMVHARMRAGK